MNCEFCDRKTKKKNVKRQHWLKKLYMIEDVPAEVCRECGEKYYHAKTFDTIDKYLFSKHKEKENLNVEVVSLTHAPI